MNYKKCLGRFATASNVPVDLTYRQAQDQFGRDKLEKDPIIYVKPRGNSFYPGDDAVMHNFFDGGGDWTVGLAWSVSSLLKHVEPKTVDGPRSDFHRAWEVLMRRSRGIFGVNYLTFATYTLPPVIQVPSPVVVLPSERFHLYSVDGAFLYVEYSAIAADWNRVKPLRPVQKKKRKCQNTESM